MFFWLWVICQEDIYHPQNSDIYHPQIRTFPTPKKKHLPGGQLPPPIFFLFFWLTFLGWQCGKFGALPIGDQPRSGGTQGVGTGTAPCRQYLPVLGRGIWIYLHLNVAIQATTIITSKSIGVKPQVFESFPPCCILQYWGCLMLLRG